MNKIFTFENFPYLFTLVIAILGFQFNYLVDNSFEVPILEYEFIQINADTLIDGDYYAEKNLILRNISSNKSIDDLNLQLKYPNEQGWKLDFPELDPISPSGRITKDPGYRHNMLNYSIKLIQPGLAYKLTFFTTSKDVNPLIFYETKSPTKIERRSIYTSILRNHLTINILVMIGFIAIGFFYVLMLYRNFKNKSTINEANSDSSL